MDEQTLEIVRAGLEAIIRDVHAKQHHWANQYELGRLRGLTDAHSYLSKELQTVWEQNRLAGS